MIEIDQDKIKAFYNNRFREIIAKQPECGNIQGSLSFFKTFDIPKTFKILDVGTYIGTFPFNIYSEGWRNVYGIDISDVSIGYGRHKYRHIKDRLYVQGNDRMPFGENEFDVVTMFNVIEHIPRIGAFLDEVVRVMKTEGIVILMTPNKPIDMIYENFQIQRGLDGAKSHCSLRTIGSIREDLRKCGFHSIRFRRVDLKTDYYRGRAKKHLGPLGTYAINVLSRLPLSLYPTISLSAIKG